MVFDVSGRWNATQSDGTVVSVDMRHRGANGVIHGSARHSGTVRGSVEGLMTGNAFHMVITWNNGTEGEYNGQFSAQGRITGMTFDRRHPSNQLTWVSSKVFSETNTPITNEG